MSLRRLVIAAALLCTPSLAHAQTDQAGCKDHPLFNRMPNHYIEKCESSAFEARKFPIAPEKEGDPARLVEVEGPLTVIVYRPTDGSTKASPLQIQRNFQNAAKAAQGTVEGSFPDWCNFRLDESFKVGNHCTDRGTTLKFTKDGKEIWVFVNGTSMPYTGHSDGYSLTIMEREAMSQDIAANDLLASIDKDGMVALYLNFATGSATIEATSNGQLDEIAAMLKSRPALSLEVGGHTDNVGSADANMKLSESRAAAVVKALTDRGIPAERLTAKGYGQTSPVADNRTEEGRGKNRRVELSKRN